MMAKRTSSPVLPSAPSGLVAVAVGSSQVILAWAEGGNGALGFRIERAAGSSLRGPFVEIGRVGPHVTAYHDESVRPRSTYSYRVRTRNASIVSSPSNVVVVTTPHSGKETPTD
jgi:hypothetical protein